MKKVKTYLFAIMFILMSSVLGACSCGGPDIAVVDLKITEVSDNMVYNEETGEYMVMQGETFSIGYELLPDNATDVKVFVDVTPSNRVNYTDYTVNSAKKTVEFTAARENKGSAVVSFSSNDGSKKSEVKINIVSAGDLTRLSTPANLKYDETNKKFKWDEMYFVSGAKENVAGYQLSIRDGSGEEQIVKIDQKQGDSFPTEYAYRLESGVDYYVKIKALGSLTDKTYGSEYSGSTKFYVLPSPTNLKNNKGLITWDYPEADRERITGYQITYGNGQRVDNLVAPAVTQFDISKYFINNGITLSNFAVEVRAVNNNINGVDEDGTKTYIISSRVNPSISLTQLSAPSSFAYTLECPVNSCIGKTVLSWQPVVGANGYDVKITKYGTTTTVYSEQNRAGVKLNLSELLESGKYTAEITSIGDTDRTIGEAKAKSVTNFVVLPLLNGNIKYAQNVLELNLTELSNLIGFDNIENRLLFEAFTKKYGFSFDNANGKCVVPAGQTVDLTAFNYDTPYQIMVRPIVKIDSSDTITIGGTAFNVVSPLFEESETSSIENISQLRPATVEGVNNLGVVTFVDENIINQTETYKYRLTLLKNGSTTERVVENILIENGGLIGVDEADSRKKSIDLNNVFVNLLNDVGNYEIRVIPSSNNRVDASSSASATQYYQFKKLNAVSSITIGQNNIITWARVDGADHYEIQINSSKKQAVTSLEYQVTETLTNYNTVAITAIGDDKNAINSSTYTFENISKASDIENLRVENGVLVWNEGVANSKYYVSVSLGEGLEPTTAVLTANHFDGLTGIGFANNATITIKHGIENGTNMSFNSNVSTPIKLSRLDIYDFSNSFEIVDNSNNVRFLAVEGAGGYNVRFRKGGVTTTYSLVSSSNLVSDTNILFSASQVVVDEDTLDYVYFELPSLADGEWTISIQAIPADQTASVTTVPETGESYIEFKVLSEYSSRKSFVIYPKVKSVSANGNLTWQFDQPMFLDNFEIKFLDGTHNGKKFYVSGYSFAFDKFLDGEDYVTLEGGSYQIGITARANTANVVYADPTLFTVTKLSKPILSVVDEKPTFPSVANAVSYELYQNGELITSGFQLTVDKDNVVVSGLTHEYGMDYTYSIRAIAGENFVSGLMSNEVKLSKLSVPLNASKNDTAIEWGEVENSEGYIVTYDGNSTPCSSNSFSLPDMTEAKEYQFSIVAKGGKLVGGKYMLSSDPLVVKAYRLAGASQMQVNDNVFSFSYDGVSHPSKYQLYLEYQQEEAWTSVLLKEYDYVEGTAPSYSLDQITNYDGYKLKVKCLGSDETFSLDGAETYFKGTINGVEGQVFQKVTTPEFTYASGVLSVTASDDYRAYEVFEKIEGEFELLPTSNYRIINEKFTLLRRGGENLTIVVRAKASSTSGKIDSNLSSEIVVNGLPKITDFRIECNTTGETSDYSGTFRWTAVKNATGYNIYYKKAEDNTFDSKQVYFIDGGATTNCSFETIFSEKSLQDGTDYDFVIVALGGQVSGTMAVCYLNSTNSNEATVRCVNGVESIEIKNGVISWKAVDGVNGYLLSVYSVNGENLIPVFNRTLTTTTFDLGERSELDVATNYVAVVVPVSTESSNYVIVTAPGEGTGAGVKERKIYFTRYNILESVKVEDGVLKLTLTATSRDEIEVIEDLYEKYVAFIKDAEEGTSVNDALQFTEDDKPNYIKYYGYFNIRMYIEGFSYEDITPDKVRNSIFDADNGKIVFYYEPRIKVASTTKLYLHICALGNEASDINTSNALPTFKKDFSAYKYSAPVTTMVENLTTSNGGIVFTRVVDGKGAYVTKYLLKAVCNESTSVPAGSEVATHININTLYAEIDTNGLVDSREATFILLDASDLTKCYYGGKTQNFHYYYYGSNGEKMEWSQDGGSKKLLNNKLYTFTLTTLGTPNSDTAEGDCYLRSNAYETVQVTYLYDYSAFGYKCESNSTDGGYLVWERNEKCLGYELYVISKEIAEEKYGNQINEAKVDGRWVSEDETKVYRIGVEETSFMFYNTTDLESGYYWCAIRPIGNGLDYITSPSTSNTVEVFKLSRVVNAQLKDGKFVWGVKSDELNSRKIVGFKIFIYTTTGGDDMSQIGVPNLIGTLDGSDYKDYDSATQTFYYEIPEELVSSGGVKYDLSGSDGKKFGLGIIAIGGLVNADQCVCSDIIQITNSGNGYARLDQVEISVNEDYGQIEWRYASNEQVQKDNTRNYIVYINDVEQTGTFNAYQLSNFVSGGTYGVSVRANATGTYLNSLKSSSYKIVKYYDPKIVVKNGVIEWGNDQNGISLVPKSTSITVKDAITNSMVDSNNNLTGDITTYILKDSLVSGYYIVSLRYNSAVGEDHGVSVYHIGSEESTIKVYKLSSPQLDYVEIMDEEGITRSQETGFDSALKWDVVNDGNGELCERYYVEIYVKNNNDEYELKASTIFTKTGSNVYVRDEKNQTEEYPNKFNANYLFEYNKINNIIYLNISVDKLGSLVGNVVTGKELSISVSSLGNTVSDTSGEYDALVNSSASIRLVDFTTTKPENNNSDTVNGIIRWTGSDNPVKITYTYQGEIKTVWLGASYIEKYGKIYYLPYTSNVTYNDVTIQFILGNTYFSNKETVVVGNVNLFESGEGTEAKPYIIKARGTFTSESDRNSDISAQIANIKYRPNSVIKIDSSVSEINVGSWDIVESFYGKLLGNASERGSNARLTNIKLSYNNQLSASEEAKISVFGELKEGAIIQDIDFAFATTIEGVNGAIANSLSVAGLAQFNYGTISNVGIKGADGNLTSSIRAYSQRNVSFAGAVINNYGTMQDVTVYNSFVAVIRNSPLNLNFNIIGSGLVFNNYGIVDECVVDGKINAGADSSEKIKNRMVGGIAVNNYALIINSDFTGTLQGWTMGGITINNYYFATNDVKRVTLSKVVDGETTSQTYMGGCILGCLSKGTYIIAKGSSCDPKSNDICIGGVVSRLYGGVVARCYAVLKNAYTKSTDTNANYGLNVGSENSGFSLSVLTDKGSSVYIGSVVGLLSTSSQGDQTNQPLVKNTFGVLDVSISNNKTDKLKIGGLVGIYLSSNSNYGIAGNIYYSATNNPNAISGISSSASQTVSIESESTIRNYVNEEDGGLNSDNTLCQVRHFVYDSELKLEI